MSNFNFSGLESSGDRYGLIIILITILTRIFIVSIAWSYGIFLPALKKNYPNAHFVELGWISGLAQGLGSLLSPLYIRVYKALGVKCTFAIGLCLCFISLLSSSYVPNEHWLFLTYSVPFGLGSSILFVTGSIVTGLYYPPSSRHHVSASVAVSLGFPLGFLALNLLTEFLMIQYNNDWQIVQRVYSMVAFACLLLFAPFFTDEHVGQAENERQGGKITFNETLFNMTSSQFGTFIKILWLIGLMANSCATTAIVTHMSGYWVFLGLDVTSMNLTFITLGLADALFRVILAVTGRYFKSNLLLCYIFQAFIGLILSSLWTNEINPLFNTVYCFLFGMCPAVLMSLMYTVNSEISGEAYIEKNYTLNVMVSGIGIIFGPILSGFLLDSSKKNYEDVFSLAAKLYLISIVLYFSIKIMLIKYQSEETGSLGCSNEEHCRREYIEFKNNDTNH